MSPPLLLMGIVILICIVLNRLIQRLAVPSLLIFIALGMVFGENGLFRIHFDDYHVANIICSVCLIFIMFYGGFGTNLKAARPVLAKSVVLSTLGVMLTAGLTGLFAHLALGLPLYESLLIGAVISSTDAASVFNILRTGHLSLKYGSASLLEVESGSNDPMSYMLTVILVSVMSGASVSVPRMLLSQVVFGVLCGVVMGKLAVLLLSRLTFSDDHGRTILVFAVAIIAYALPDLIGGNGYLSVYLCGILMGNASVSQKRYLIHFFDVVTGVCQVMIFFLLGLLVTPAELPAVFLPALCIMAFLTFIGRPAVVSAILLPFRSRPGQIGIVSWAGLRGVASIVFAIYAVLGGVTMTYNLFNLVFCIVLLSIAFQGTLLPWVSRKLNMIDPAEDVSKTFNDYQEDNDVDFIKVHIADGHPWIGKSLAELALPHNLLAVMIARDGRNLVPDGQTVLADGDLLVFAARAFEDRENLSLREVPIDKGHKWNGRSLREISTPQQTLVILIQRGAHTMIPDGGTRIQTGDVLVLAQPGKP